MRILCVLLLLPIVASLMAMDFETRCHSQQFTRAKRSLDRMILTQVQRDAIKTHEAAFYRAWNNTHRRKGCSHHEAHAVEFIAAASGVLTDAQFKSFRKRARNEVEHVQHEVWQTGVYIDNLIKIAAKL